MMQSKFWAEGQASSLERLCAYRLSVDPRHSIARDQRRLRVRPKSRRGYSPVGRDHEGFGQAFVDWPSFIGHVERLIPPADKVAIGERVLNMPCSTDPTIKPDGSGNKRV